MFFSGEKVKYCYTKDQILVNAFIFKTEENWIIYQNSL